jgi:hypothetical protein
MASEHQRDEDDGEHDHDPKRAPPVHRRDDLRNGKSERG